MSIADDLTRLAELRDRGVLTADEFEAAKRRLIATDDEAADQPGVPDSPQTDAVPGPPVLPAPAESSPVGIFVVLGLLGLGVFVALAVASGSARRGSPDTLASADALELMADSVELVDDMMIDEMMLEEPASSAAWMFSTDVSQIDDSRSVYAQLEAREPVYYSYGKSYTPMLTLRCMEGTTAAYINWGEYLGLDDTPVEVRVDDSPARERRWNISTDNTSAGLWYGGAAIPFVQSLVDSDRLVARVTPYSESTVTATFTTTGLRPHAEKIAEACGWTL